MKELVPMTELNFDKGDVAAIAVAEAEKTMRKKVRSHHAAIADCEKAIEATKEEIQKQGEIVIQSKLAAKIKKIKAGLKATKIPNFTAKLDITINPRGYESTKRTNQYNLEIAIIDKDDFLRFLKHCGNEVRIVELMTADPPSPLGYGGQADD